MKYTKLLNSMRLTAFINRWNGDMDHFEMLEPICKKLLPGIIDPLTVYSLIGWKCKAD